MVLAIVLLLGLALPGAATMCSGSNSLGDFRLTAIAIGREQPLRVRGLNRLLPGYKIRFEPLQQKNVPEDARVAIMLVPAGKDASDLVILEPKPAREGAEWESPERASAVALVYAPNGLSMKKLRSMGEKNPQMVSELAAYAEQSAQVEALVDALAQSERGETTLDAALTGFSSRYGMAMPKLEANASTDQQAASLLRALMPAMSSYDPLVSSRASMMQQSAGLATSVAAMFWGNPVGLAAGGAALFQNLRTILFPDTEFRTAFAQADQPALSLCAKTQPSKSRTRLAYLWAHRIPDVEAPQLSLLNESHVPAGIRSTVSITGKGLPLAARLKDWKLGGQPISVIVQGDRLTLDLTAFAGKPGPAQLAAAWDWDTATISGTVQVHALEDLSTARVTSGILVEGLGKSTLQLGGPDFQFIEGITLNGAALPFRLPNGSRAGEQRTLEVDIDTATLKRGSHSIRMIQGDGTPVPVAVTVLPPHPTIQNLPLRINRGETQQVISLRGTGLSRLTALRLKGVETELLQGSDLERPLRVKLDPAVRKGTMLSASMGVQDVPSSLSVEKFAAVAGPRPVIVASAKTLNSAVSLRPDEVIAGAAASFSLSTKFVEKAPSVDLFCRQGEERSKLKLRPGDRSAAARLDLAGDGLLFLSIDPGAVGHPGCELVAVLETVEGESDPLVLGRVTRVPAITGFSLTDEKVGDASYAAIITGTGLETIEKTGWDGGSGLPVTAIPTASADDPLRQTLRVAMPWPSPAPHAPLFIWLRGESDGRATGVKY